MMQNALPLYRSLPVGGERLDNEATVTHTNLAEPLTFYRWRSNMQGIGSEPAGLVHRISVDGA